MVNSFINDGEAAVKESEKKAGLGADALANLQVSRTKSMSHKYEPASELLHMCA